MGRCSWLCCWIKRTANDGEAEEEEEVICPPAISTPPSESSSVAESAKMGKVASKVKSYFSTEGSVAVHPEPGTDRAIHLPVSSIENGDRVIEPLVSPRSPLVRNIETLTPPDTPPSVKRQKLEKLPYLDIALLHEESTISYIQSNKVMIILKGLSGSGKSTIAKSLQIIYPEAVMCSADYYFMVDGEYKFDFEKLKDAHESCQDKARQAAKRNEHVIIIDNTNVRYWESQVYLEMCQEYHYVAIFIETQTPWRFDAAELAKRTIHDVGEDILRKKVKGYQHISPIYYAWFLNEPDSQMVSRIAWQALERALLEVQDFYQDFAQFTGMNSIEDMLGYYQNKKVTLHMTAKFTGRGKREGAMEYITDPSVKSSVGRCYPVAVVGYIITPRTFGARVKLTEEQLKLWGADDYEKLPDNMMEWRSSKADATKESNDNSISHDSNDIGGMLDLCEPRVIYESQKNDRNRFYPTSGKGRRAHLTLGCAPGMKPVTTGLDVIDVVSLEQEVEGGPRSLDEMDVDSDIPDNNTYSISGSILKSYGQGRWAIYPENKAVLDSLFSALY